MKTTGAFLAGTALGATATYIGDPKLGKRRRAMAKDAVLHLAKILRRAVDKGVRDSENRTRGIFLETKRRFKSEKMVADPVLEDRVHTAIYRYSSHPNVEVIAHEGYVTLLGPVVDQEEKLIFTAAKSVRGVRAVQNRMKPYKPPDFLPTQQSRPKGPPDILQTHWAPATRMAAGGIGAAALMTGLGSGGAAKELVRLGGLALVLRALTNMEFKRLLGIKAGPYAVDIIERGKRPRDAARRAA